MGPVHKKFGINLTKKKKKVKLKKIVYFFKQLSSE